MKVRIPKIPHAFFRWYCKQERYEELHGDLEEFFYERVDEKGLAKARLYYLLDVIRCCQPYAWKKPKIQENSNMGMIKNYYFTAVRNMLRHKRSSLINFSGLSIGIVSFVFISLYIINEVSYDRFHTNSKSIYRVSNRAVINGKQNNSATTNSPLTRILLKDYPEVAAATRILKSDPMLVGRGGKKIIEEGVLFADSSFFDVFDFKLVKGNPETALVHPRSMVLSESYAKKYFGEEDPVGREITVEEDTIFYTITGIVEDVPPNSHIQFDMIGSMSTHGYWNDNRWIGIHVHAYIQLYEGAQPARFEEKIQVVFHKYLAPEIEHYTGQPIAEWESSGNTVKYALIPITDIHLRSDYANELEPTGNISYIYIYAAIALIILFIAIFNYVNMATAQSATRAKEVGIRKVMGSTKSGLVYQFIFESIVISMLATVFACILVALLMPSFTDLIGRDLAFGGLSAYWIALLMLCLATLVGILAGAYPAFVLATFKPVNALKGSGLKVKRGSGWVRNSLVVMQFTASIVIIIGTLVVYNQINFMLTKNLGFDKDQVLVIRRPDVLKDQLETFKNDLLLNPNVRQVVHSKTIPGKDYAIRSYRPVDNPETFIFMNNLVGFNYEEVMGLELVAGRFFSREYPSDSNAVVINEAAAKALGYNDPLGKKLTSPWHMDELLTIIGVVKDYNIASLHKKIEPVALELMPTNEGGYVSVKLSNDQNVRQTVQYVENAWFNYSADHPFQYFFFDADYQRLYKSESTTGQIFIIFTVLSILIACLGLVGLITFNISVRKKEVGIRKVLGAGTRALVWLLSSEIVRLIMVATLVAWPIAYFAADYWLENFADRITLNPWMYLGATGIVVLIGSLAIGFQTIKASTSNPIDSLRQE